MASVIGAGSAEQRQARGNAGGGKGRPASQRLNEKSERQNRTSPDDVGRLIEREIIPRLMLAHSESRSIDVEHEEGAPIGPETVEDFALKSIAMEAEELILVVDALLAKNVSAEAVFVDLLAPSARRLGQYWEEDVCDFVDVTMGLWRLQEVMRDVASRSPVLAHCMAAPRSALFASMPEEQHSFGALMVEECFARAGWDTQLLVGAERTELLSRIGERSFDLVGLTVSCDCHIEPLSHLITAVRNVSKNGQIKIMVGGAAINASPDRARQVGADGFARNARKAVDAAEELVGEVALQASAAG